ncbi:MAG: NAD(P)/FAD-dependent oxidoreductase [Pyrinomonadaceae bacterium]
MSTYDIAIVGAGIVGAACAAALAAEGMSVAIIDCDAPASGTTAAGMGHIVVMDDTEAQLALTSYSRQLWSELAPQLPAACEYQRCGTVWVAADDDEMEEARRKHAILSDRGITCEMLDEKSIREAEPNLGENIAGGLMVSDDAVVYQLAATKYLIDTAVTHGATARFGSAVTSLAGGCITLQNGDTITAASIINAVGARAHELTPGLEIVPKKGHLVITDRYSDIVRHQVLELGYAKSAHGSQTDSVAFNVQPRPTGQVLIGSSRQLGKNDRAIDRDILRRMILRAIKYMPSLTKLNAIRAWTGIRPATRDNLPYIGEIPGLKNVFAAAGHEGLGITTSLATAAILRDLILRRETAIPHQPYSPARTIA